MIALAGFVGCTAFGASDSTPPRGGDGGAGGSTSSGTSGTSSTSGAPDGEAGPAGDGDAGCDEATKDLAAVADTFFSNDGSECSGGTTHGSAKFLALATGQTTTAVVVSGLIRFDMSSVNVQRLLGATLILTTVMPGPPTTHMIEVRAARSDWDEDNADECVRLRPDMGWGIAGGAGTGFGVQDHSASASSTAFNSAAPTVSVTIAPGEITARREGPKISFVVRLSSKSAYNMASSEDAPKAPILRVRYCTN